MRFKCIRSESYGIVGYDDDRRDGLIGETISRVRPALPCITSSILTLHYLPLVQAERLYDGYQDRGTLSSSHTPMRDTVVGDVGRSSSFGSFCRLPQRLCCDGDEVVANGTGHRTKFEEMIQLDVRFVFSPQSVSHGLEKSCLLFRTLCCPSLS